MFKEEITTLANSSFLADKNEIMEEFKTNGVDSARALADILSFGSAALEWDGESIDDKTVEISRKIYKEVYINGLEHGIEALELQATITHEAEEAFEKDIPVIKRFIGKPNLTVRLDNRSDRAFRISLRHHSFSHEQEEYAHEIFHDCYHKLFDKLSSHR